MFSANFDWLLSLQSSYLLVYDTLQVSNGVEPVLHYSVAHLEVLEIRVRKITQKRLKRQVTSNQC